MKEWLQEYEVYLQAKNVSKNTYDSYVHDLSQFFKFLEKNDSKLPSQIQKPELEDYVTFLRNEKKSVATITRNIASIRNYYDFLLMQGKVSENPAKAIKLERVQKKMPEILSSSEITQLLAQPDVKDAKGCRDKAMLELLYATGIRVSELVELNLSDINLSRGLLHCHSGKYDRMVPVYPAAISAVSDYIHRVRNLMINSHGGEALFINLNGSRLTRQGFWKIIKGYATSAKIPKEITPHTLRHSFALHLLENGATVKDIQTMMGHADISSTLVYVHMMDNHLKEVYNHCHPRAKI